MPKYTVTMKNERGDDLISFEIEGSNYDEVKRSAARWAHTHNTLCKDDSKHVHSVRFDDIVLDLDDLEQEGE